MHVRFLGSVCLFLAVATQASCAGGAPPAAPPAFAAIDSATVAADEFALAGDAMRGREAGTLDELRAAAWVAERARDAGLEPAGADGTYFQFWPLRRIRPAATSTVSLDGRPLALWSDVAIVTPVDAALDQPVTYVGAASNEALAQRDLRGRVVVATLLPPENPPVEGMSLREWRWALAAVRERTSAIAARSPAAVILVSDSIADGAFARAAVGYARGRYGLDSAGAEVRVTGPAVLWVRQALGGPLARPGARVQLRLASESFVYPSVNVVARVRGRDAAVAGEYVLFSGHHDHDGVRLPVDGDSIYNGADDNASVCVGLLAIGRALVRAPARRSALFVWHGAEERGLLGSRWFVRHPLVPLDSIVAVLNADMIGRNNPDSAALLGSQPPHRNSTALVAMALAANDAYFHFAIDSTWDRPTHPEFWYFRSDHLPYARAGVPALYFSTMLHPDYHTPRDEPSRIDVAKLVRMARWMYATGWAAANAATRPAVDSGFHLER